MSILEVRSGSETIERLVPIVRRWQLLVADYTSRVPKTERGDADAPYWYNERPNVGILAAAAWMEGVPSLEEFSEDKLFDSDRTKGRMDLWMFLFGDAEGVAVEAKHQPVWKLKGVGAEQVEAKVVSSLRDAENDCRKLDPGYPRRLAASFVVPGVPSTETSWLEESFLPGVRAAPDVDLLAWAPAATGTSPVDGNFEYPGVMLCVRDVS